MLKIDSPILNYRDEKWSRQLAIGFLRTFWGLATDEYSDALTSLQYTRNKFILPKSQLSNKKKLDVTCNYLYDPKIQRIIFLEYGKLDDATMWLPIFKTLLTSFSSLYIIPPINDVSCWDLTKGNTFNILFSNIGTVPSPNITSTAVRIINL
ncbi:hypothetical protein [Gordoniibacillus kamchatkensis]|uniref:hypothetical protein n=1 Tax=Gordoniibacillus kamchatkensis TaxID=1590651 RepID=UPI0012E09BD2|nr:hypothetical protein [Paenibacillus sp. VKM B-2647]